MSAAHLRYVDRTQMESTRGELDDDCFGNLRPIQIAADDDRR
jgi:hypothetical protein